MAITKNQQQNLALSNIDWDNPWDNPITVSEYIPTDIQIKKKILVDNEWQDRIFVQLDCSKKLEEWLLGKYPNQGYLKDWWKTGTRVTMTDKVYVHWKLME